MAGAANKEILCCFGVHVGVSGRPRSLLVLERFIAHVYSYPAARWVTFEEVAEDFTHRFPLLGSLRPESVRETWERGLSSCGTWPIATHRIA